MKLCQNGTTQPAYEVTIYCSRDANQLLFLGELRNGSTTELNSAINQVSAVVYPSLVDSEINHLQNNLLSIRDRIVLQYDSLTQPETWSPWVRGYGISGNVDDDACLTSGYRQEIGGVELGTGWTSLNGLAFHGYTHLSSSTTKVFQNDQSVQSDAYSFGGAVQYAGDSVYAMATGGGGFANHEGRRNMTGLSGTFANSNFDGTNQFGLVEAGTVRYTQDSIFLTFVSLQGARVETDSFSEISDSPFAVNVNAMSSESLRSMTGFSFSKTAATSIGPATSQVRLGWLHEFLDETRQATTMIAGTSLAATGPLLVQSAETGTDWLSLGLQLDWAILMGGELTTAYQGNVNNQSSFHGGFVGARWIW